MKPGPANALKLIAKYLSIDSRPVRARDLLTRICLSEAWEDSRHLAAERSESWENPFLRKAREELSELNRLGRFSAFSFNDSSPYLVQGAVFIEPHDSPEIIQAKENRARHARYAEEIAGLTPKRFEALCAGILSLLGVEQPVLTPLSADEGIDFFGNLSLEQRLLPNPAYVTFVRQMSIWLIGQAKHYSTTQVATPDLRDLVGSIELAKSRTHVGRSPQLGEYCVRLCDPVYYLFFTTGRISADAWKLIDRSGIIGMDGEMIAAFLADQEIGVENGLFKSQTFCHWVEHFAT